MRLPNGYGSVSQLSGNRRRPYIARKSVTIDGQHKQHIIGYYATKADALQALAKHNNTATITSVTTFYHVYERWLSSHTHVVGHSAVAGYKSSVRHLRSIYTMPIHTIKYEHLQAVIDCMRYEKGLSYATCKKVRSLINLVFDYAIVKELTATNYGKYLQLGRNTPIKPHTVFTRQQINKLWRSNHPHNHVPLLLLYTGMRSAELRHVKRSDVNIKQKYIRITQSKTKAGIRIIPIHDRILPIILELLQRNTRYLLSDVPLTYAQFANLFNAVMAHERIKHTTHDCRHTFATLLSNANANEVARRRLLGHVSSNVTDAVYTHKALPQLRKAIKLLK